MYNNILEKIVKSKKLPVLFIGSGISKRYLLNYPNWEQLLRKSYSKIDKDNFKLQKHIDKFKRENNSDFDINIKLGSIIEQEFNEAFYDRRITLPCGNKKGNWVDRGISPYKIYLSFYFKKYKLTKDINLQKEIETFKLLKNKISAVITTNYDCFLEKEIFNTDYQVFKRQNELFSIDSYSISEIYKIHGCATDAESIIITESDYNKFENSRKLFTAKMLTLFADSPIIFLGYSFTDQNIQSIIIDFLNCLSPKDLQNIEEHFIFISYKENQNDFLEVKRVITTTNGNQIPITEIETNNFLKIYETLNKITPGVSPVRIRELKRVIKKIVDKNIEDESVDSIMIDIDQLNELSLSNKPLAIAVGTKEELLNKYGYTTFDDIIILEDILYDNKKLNANEMCKYRFKSLSYTRLIPVFKYVKNTTFKIDENSKIGVYIEKHNSTDKIIAKNIRKSLKNVKEISDIDILKKEIKEISTINKKSGLLLKNISNFSLSEIRDICKEIFKLNKEEAKKSTYFKRCIMFLDYKENYMEYIKKKEQ